MPQEFLPHFSHAESGFITDVLSYGIHEGSIFYFHGSFPIFNHAEHDRKSFRMITSQFYVNGSAKQSEICRAFGVSPISVKRGVKLYREKGMAGFFEERKRRGAAVLTPPVVEKAQELLDTGHELPAVADKLGLKQDTLRKAVQSGKLHKPVKKSQ